MTLSDKQPQGLAAALAAFQAEVPTVPKNKTAEVQTRTGGKYTYKYADLADMSGMVLPLLGKHGLCFTSQPGLREDGRFGLAYQLLHSSGEMIEGFYELDGNLSAQAKGGEITYARRYCLGAVTGVAAEEDTDARGAEEERQARRARVQEVVSQQQSVPQEAAQAPAEPNPEVQALADLAWQMAGKPVTVAELEEGVYNVARSHRGWLTSRCKHPGDGSSALLSAVIRDAKTKIEETSRVAAQETDSGGVSYGE